MSDTGHVTHHLSEYLDHALPAQEQHAVEKHLEQCKECSARYKELQQLRQRLKTVPELTPPENFYQGVLEQIERDKKPFLIWDWPVATKALAAFGVLMVVVMVAREARRSEPELFAPVAPAATPEAAPAAPSPVSQAVAPVGAPQSVAPSSLTEVPIKKADMENAKSVMPTNAPAALKQKTAREIRASNLISRDEEAGELKDLDQLKPIPQARANTGAAEKTLVAGSGGSLAASTVASPVAMVAGNAALQARDINGPATQASFGERQQSMAKEVSTAPSPATPVQEWKGHVSAISIFRTVVITNDADWNALWAEHSRNQTPPSPVPKVDFDRYTAVAVFEGTISEIKNGSDAVSVLYREQLPAATDADHAGEPVISPTYDIRLIPKISLPITFVKIP